MWTMCGCVCRMRLWLPNTPDRSHWPHLRSMQAIPCLLNGFYPFAIIAQGPVSLAAVKAAMATLKQLKWDVLSSRQLWPEPEAKLKLIVATMRANSTELVVQRLGCEVITALLRTCSSVMSRGCLAESMPIAALMVFCILGDLVPAVLAAIGRSTITSDADGDFHAAASTVLWQVRRPRREPAVLLQSMNALWSGSRCVALAPQIAEHCNQPGVIVLMEADAQYKLRELARAVPDRNVGLIAATALWAMEGIAFVRCHAFLVARVAVT